LEHGCNIPLAIPFSELNIQVPLPDKRSFPASLQSLGDHIKAARLQHKTPIKDLINELAISRETLRGWELNQFEPHVVHYPKIIKLLGYWPFSFETNSIAGKIKKYRYCHGLTQLQFAKLLGTHTSMVWHWECNNRIPLDDTRKRILALVEAIH
jgi:DNA-binding transcriptional regulator YiaG